MLRLLAVLALLPLAACRTATPPAAPAVSFAVDSVATGTTARLIGLDAAGNGVVWAAGTNGAWARSLDGGRSWTTGTVPDADTLQFRDVEAFDARRAVLLSIGPGTASRVYTTDDGGATWALRWTNPDPRAFYDCMAFDGQTGFAFSDAVPLSADLGVPHRLPIVATSNGGATWRDVTEDRTFSVPAGTGAFASSGTCAAYLNGQWLVAFNQPGSTLPKSRVGIWAEEGWKQTTVPVVSDEPMVGVSSVVEQGDAVFAGLLGADSGVTLFRADRQTIASGVNRVQTRIQRPAGDDQAQTNTWLPMPPLPIERVYGLAASPKALVATGPDGLAASADGGQTWRLLVRADLWSATRVDDRTFVAVGRGGRAVRVTVR